MSLDFVTIVHFCCSDWSSPSSLKLAVVTSTSFRRFNSHNPSASTSTGDPLPSLQTFFFSLTTSSMRLLKLYLFIAFLQSTILHTHTYRNAYISLIVFICLNCCFCKRVCVVFVCGQVLDGVLSYEEECVLVWRWGVLLMLEWLWYIFFGC